MVFCIYDIKKIKIQEYGLLYNAGVPVHVLSKERKDIEGVQEEGAEEDVSSWETESEMRWYCREKDLQNYFSSPNNISAIKPRAMRRTHFVVRLEEEK